MGEGDAHRPGPTHPGPESSLQQLDVRLGWRNLRNRCPRRLPNVNRLITTTLHARTCHRDGAHVNIHQPVSMSRRGHEKVLTVPHHVESGDPFLRSTGISAWTSSSDGVAGLLEACRLGGYSATRRYFYRQT